MGLVLLRMAALRRRPQNGKIKIRILYQRGDGKSSAPKEKEPNMKKISWLLSILLVICLCGCGKTQEEVTLYVDCHGESVKRELSFLRGGKKILTFYPEFQIGFMKFLQKSSDGNSFRATFEFADSGMDYKKYLLDLTDDGDKRYLILTEYLGGNDAFNYRGYLIDTKDNFAIIGEVPAGEICDYPTGNKEFIFTLSDSIAYFGARGYATVSVDLKLVKGKAPELVPAKWAKFTIAPYRKLLNEKI